MTDFGISSKYTSINDIASKNQNPFLEHLMINQRTVLKRFKRGEAIITDKVSHSDKVEELNQQQKELYKLDLSIGKLVYKQMSPFVLIYTDKVIDYKKLSGVTFKLLFFIIYEKLSLGNDFIIMDSKELVEKLDISRNSAYTAILELVNNGILDKRNDYNWWINPNYFYCGNRLSINTK